MTHRIRRNRQHIREVPLMERPIADQGSSSECNENNVHENPKGNVPPPVLDNDQLQTRKGHAINKPLRFRDAYS